MSVFKGRRYDALFPGQRRRSRAYEGRAGREVGRLDDGRSSSDARVGYRIPEIRPGLLPLLLRASAQKGRPKRQTGVPLPWPHLQPCTAAGGVKTRFTVAGWRGSSCPSHRMDGVSASGRPRRDLMGDRPEERRHFPGDGGGDDSAPFAACDELAVATAEAQLRLPGDVAHRLRQIAGAVEQRSAHPGAEAVGPRTFDENPPGPRRLPVLVIPPRLTVSPVERSDGTSPR